MHDNANGISYYSIGTHESFISWSTVSRWIMMHTQEMSVPRTYATCYQINLHSPSIHCPKWIRILAATKSVHTKINTETEIDHSFLSRAGSAWSLCIISPHILISIFFPLSFSLSLFPASSPGVVVHMQMYSNVLAVFGKLFHFQITDARQRNVKTKKTKKKPAQLIGNETDCGIPLRTKWNSLAEPQIDWL